MQQAHLSRRVPGALVLLSALILALIVVRPAFAATPTVTSITPSSGPSAGGTSVTITGTGLTGTTAVSFGLTPATSFTFVNDTTVTAIAPAHVAGPVDVQVTDNEGVSPVVAGDVFTFVDPPTVTGLLPVTGPTTGGTTVTVAGTNFVTGAGNTTVSFGGTPAAIVAVASATQLTAVSPAHGAGAIEVRVTTAGGQSAAVPAFDTFTYASALPVIASLSPAAGTPSGGTTVTITGSGFTGATGATFGGVNVTGFIVDSDTQIRVISPAHVAGIVDVVVTGPGGSSVTGATTKYTYTVAAGPTVTALSPASSTIAGGVVVSITGTGFTGTTAVSFGGTAATGVTVVNDTTILATAPAHAAGIVDVLVTTPVGTSASVAGSKFTYGTLPVITSISPATGASGTVVTITGTGFTGATAVMFGTVSAAPTSVTDTQIVVSAPTGVSGAVDITVVTPSGTSAVVAVAKFTYPGSTSTYTLSVRWSLIVWQGKDGISATAALRGLESPDNPATNDVSGRVTAMFRWNAAGQKWDGFFPGTESIPGANDFTTLTKGVAYWTAINGSTAATWTIEQG